MNRIENIILTLATAAALLAASTANANPDPCPKTGAKNDRPATRISEDPRDGLLGEPVIKTPAGTRPVRDLELEEANSESGMRPEDGLPGLPRVKTPTGKRLPRDVNMERLNRGKTPYPTDKSPCPENKNRSRTRTADIDRNSAANRAGSLLGHNRPVLPDLNDTRTKDSELSDRDKMMGGLKDAANRNKNGNARNANTTLGTALDAAGIDPSRLDGAKTEKYGEGSKITLSDGTVIYTGPDSDELGSSVSNPDGDLVEVFPDGRVSKRKGLNGDTTTHHPNGTTTLYNPKQDWLTVVDKHGRTMTRPLDFFKGWYAKGYPADKVLDLLDPLPGHSDPDNTTFQDTLRRAGVSKEDLKNATKIETSKYDNSVSITLKDGTVIWTGPDSDEHGSSVTRPNGDQTEVYPDGRVSTRKGKNGHTITTRPDGFSTDYNPQSDTMTVTGPNGHSETRTLQFWMEWMRKGHDVADLLRIYHEKP